MTDSNAAAEESYYARVESHFVERRGSPLFISPSEWDLVCRWERQGIPLEVVKEGIDRVFERPKARAKPRKLGYCRQTVEAAFRRFREAGVGAARGGGEESEAEGLHDHLDSLVERLRRRRSVLAETTGDEKARESSSLLIEKIAELVETLAKRSPLPSPFELEKELEALDSRLVADSQASLEEGTRDELLREAESSLASYRERMPEKVYRAAIESAYRRRLRKRLDLPTLSLYDR